MPTVASCATCSDCRTSTWGGWLIFGLPPAEVAVHPSNENDVHEFYLMCEDVEAFRAQVKKHRVSCGPVQDQNWGLLTQVTLPGGGKLGIYQPRHARPRGMSAGTTLRISLGARSLTNISRTAERLP